MKFNNHILVSLLLLMLFNCSAIIFAQENLSEYLRQLTLNDNEYDFNQTLSAILKPRVPGTVQHDAIANHIQKLLHSYGFETELDQFTDNAPIFGEIKFTNIIGKLNSNAEKYLVLACHYDSKYFKDNPNFVAAIDSAVPCAIILNTIKVLSPQLNQLKQNTDISLMVIFFDGEEAFLEWNENDSVYGSKHLAHKMAHTITNSIKSNQKMRYIEKIEVLVLLDLIGAENSKFYNFFRNTLPLHNFLVRTERILSRNNLLEGRNYQFVPQTVPAFIDDDHRPFLKYKVPVLHLISTPFPKQWHTKNDTIENLHWPSIRNFNRVLRMFVHEYLTK